MPFHPHEFPIIERDTDRQAIIMPNRAKGFSFPERCVFAFIDDSRFQRFVGEKGGRKIGEYNNINKIFDVVEINILGNPVAFCQAGVGAPVAVMMLDFLIGYGVRTVISAGCCGALVPLALDELLVPTSAVRDEGTSYHYMEAAREIALDAEPARAIQQAISARGLHWKPVKTWTNDAFFRETKAVVDRRVAEGCSVVEMECSALQACARFRGAQFGQILFTADTLAEPDKYDERGWGLDTVWDLGVELAFESVVRL